MREWPRKWHGIGIGLAGIGIGFARIGTDWIVDKVMVGKGGKMVSDWRIDVELTVTGMMNWR